MYDPKRAARIDLKKKKDRGENKFHKRNLHNWSHEFDMEEDNESDQEDLQSYDE